MLAAVRPAGLAIMPLGPLTSLWVAQVVVSHSILAFQQQPPGMPLESYVWDAANPHTPEAVLLGSSQLVSAKFNVKDASLVGAGQYNGQVVLFDTRRGTAPCEVTPMDVCHRWVKDVCGG